MKDSEDHEEMADMAPNKAKMGTRQSRWQERIDAVHPREKLMEMAKKSGLFEVGDAEYSIEKGIRTARRKSMMRRMEDLKYTKEEVREMFATISAMTEEEIDYLLGDPNASVLEKVLARTYKEAIIYGSYKRIRDIIELFSGKAEVTSTTNHNHNFSMPAFRWAENKNLEEQDDTINIEPNDVDGEEQGS